MRIPRAPHRWSVTPRAAVAIQRRLAERVDLRAAPGPFRTVVGTDMAFTLDGSTCIAAAIVWDITSRCVVEQQIARRAVTFPYVPGLLTFREAPTVLAALRKLRHTPDAMMCDGQGFAHPRRIGLASHLGVVTGLPTVGCAKSLLIGKYIEPGKRRGDRTPLLDGDTRIGTVLRTRDNVQPLYISVGHRLSLAQAEDLVLACGAGFRMPEPTRLADQAVGQARRSV